MGAFSTSASAKGKTVGARPIAVILGEIVTRAKDFTNADGAAIAIRDGDAAVTRATTGGIAPDIGVRLSIEGSFAGMALKQGTAMHCEDSDSDARVDAEKCRMLKTRSFVVVPIRGGGASDFVGVLAVFSSSPHAFTRTDLAVLKTTADQVAYELKNIRPSDTSLNDGVQVAESVQAAVTETLVEPVMQPVKPEPITPPQIPVFKPTKPETSASGAATAVAPAPEKPSQVTNEPAAMSPGKPPLKVAEPETSRSSEVKPEVEATPPAMPVSPKPPRASKLSAPEPPIKRKEEPVVSLAEAIERPATPPPARPTTQSPEPESKPAVTPNTSPLAPNAYEEWRGFATVQDESSNKSKKWLIIGGAAAVVVVIAILGIRALTSRGENRTTSTPAATPTETSSAPVSNSPSAPTPTTSKPVETKSTNTAAVPEPAKTPAKEPAPKAAALVPNSPAPVRRAQEPDAAAPQISMAPTAGLALPETKVVVPNAPKVKQSQMEPSELLRKIAPKFPTFPPNLPDSETVVLRAVVRADGNVGDVQVVKGGRAFADAAIAAVKQWKYKAARMNGNPIDTNIEVVLNFRK